MGGGRRNHINNEVNAFDIRAELLKLANEDRVKYDEKNKFNILQYWNLRQYSNPQLYKLSQVILSAPATQVSVERLFSALALCLSHLRTKLSSQSLNELMLVKQNIELLDDISFV